MAERSNRPPQDAPPRAATGARTLPHASDAEASVRPMLRVAWQEDIGNVPLTKRAFLPLVSAP